MGEDQDEATRLLEARHQRGMNDSLSWWGSADGLTEHLRDLADAGATWAIMVLAGPAGRRELLAERVLPGLS